MEVSRIRLLFLIAVAALGLQGCSWIPWFHRDRAPEAQPVATAGTDASVEPSANSDPSSNQQPIIDPQVERRTIKRARIDTEDFELGAYAGILSIEDFESNVVYGARLAYHLT